MTYDFYGFLRYREKTKIDGFRWILTDSDGLRARKLTKDRTGSSDLAVHPDLNSERSETQPLLKQVDSAQRLLFSLLIEVRLARRLECMVEISG